jgi:hypothetical protein
MKDLIILFLLGVSLSFALKGKLYALDPDSQKPGIVQINYNTKEVDAKIYTFDYTRISFGSTQTAVALDDKSLAFPYVSYDARAVPYYYFIKYDLVKNAIVSNVSLGRQGFVWHSSRNNTSVKDVLVVRETVTSGSVLEAGLIQLTTGEYKVLGLYPGVAQYDMTSCYHQNKRMYYKIMMPWRAGVNTLFGIDIDTGIVSYQEDVPSKYEIHSLFSDPIKNQVFGIIRTTGVDGFILATVTNWSPLTFTRIGTNAVGNENLWSHIYVYSPEDRELVTIWATDSDQEFIHFNVDTGDITLRWVVKNRSFKLNNLMYTKQ